MAQHVLECIFVLTHTYQYDKYVGNRNNVLHVVKSYNALASNVRSLNSP